MKVTNYHMLHYMILNTSGGAKKVMPRQENKGPDKTSTGKDLTPFNPLH